MQDTLFLSAVSIQSWLVCVSLERSPNSVFMNSPFMVVIVQSELTTFFHCGEVLKSLCSHMQHRRVVILAPELINLLLHSGLISKQIITALEASYVALRCDSLRRVHVRHVHRLLSNEWPPYPSGRGRWTLDLTGYLEW